MPAEIASGDTGAIARVTVLTEPLGGSELGRRIQSGQVPPAWGMTPPSSVDGWRERVAAVRRTFDGCRWLESLGDAISGSGAGVERLRHAAAAGGVVVTTGQQPGLFGGPVYTWSKALSALALANEIEAALGVPAAPLFWAATDDADLLEAQQVWVATEAGAVALRGPATAPPGTPAAEVAQGRLDAQLDVLRSAAGSAADGALIRRVAEIYGDPSRTIGDAYLAMLAETLQPLGVPVLDASHPALRAAADPLLRRALYAHAPVAAALEARAGEIRALGLDPQVEDVAGLTPVFDRDGRGPKRRVPQGEAETVAADPSSVLGATVLLRPIVESSLVPTVAYMAGPGELAYFAQVTALAAALGVPWPLAVPRWSGTLVEPRIARLLGRLGVVPTQLADPHALESAAARAALPPELAQALADVRIAVERSTDRVGDAGATDLVPPAVLEGFRRRVEHQCARLERRIVAAVKRRESARMRDIAAARGFFFPGGRRQERALSIVPTLARYGMATLDEMARHAAAHAARLVGTDDPAAPDRPAGATP